VDGEVPVGLDAEVLSGAGGAAREQDAAVVVLEHQLAAGLPDEVDGVARRQRARLGEAPSAGSRRSCTTPARPSSTAEPDNRSSARILNRWLSIVLQVHWPTMAPFAALILARLRHLPLCLATIL
jgi:hypothetical protein